MSVLTDSVIIVLQTTAGTAMDASVVSDPTGTYPSGIQAERIVLRSDSDREAVLDLLLQNGSYVVPTYDNSLRKQMEKVEILLTEIRDLLRESPKKP